MWEKHYNPFYVALSQHLDECNSPVTIDEESLYIYENRIEYVHPCMLSNGWRVQILEEGDWKITFNGHLPNEYAQSTFGISGDSYTLRNNGTDCIELIANFIQNYGIINN